MGADAQRFRDPVSRNLCTVPARGTVVPLPARKGLSVSAVEAVTLRGCPPVSFF